jgi:drug/metabolite transporter (DMT)-like permease
MVYFYSPLVTIGLAVILLGETVTPPVLGAAVAIFAGVYISQRD